MRHSTYVSYVRVVIGHLRPSFYETDTSIQDVSLKKESTSQVLMVHNKAKFKKGSSAKKKDKSKSTVHDVVLSSSPTAGVLLLRRR